MHTWTTAICLDQSPRNASGAGLAQMVAEHPAQGGGCHRRLPNSPRCRNRSSDATHFLIMTLLADVAFAPTSPNFTLGIFTSGALLGW